MNSLVFYSPKINIMKTPVVSKNRILTGIALLFMVISISYGCTKTMDNMTGMNGNTGGTGGNNGPGTNEVWIQGMAFNPSTITVAANTTITWTNKDAVAHTVTSTTAAFGSGSIATNGVYSFTFTTAGTYPYYCTIHPSMTATVKVN
jgi:plastocyanin